MWAMIEKLRIRETVASVIGVNLSIFPDEIFPDENRAASTLEG
jgi:hypothetical protein